MMVLASVLIGFVSFSLASGFILPGPCPTLKPSEDVPKTLYFNSIISSVPFAVRKSYLFRDILLAKEPLCHSLTYGKPNLRFKYGDSSVECEFSLLTLMGLTADNSSYIFDSAVSPQQKKPCPKIREEVRFWVVKGGGYIVWSCEELNSGQDRDEAVLLVANARIYGEDEKLAEKVNNLRLNVGSYLKGPLLQKIIWPNVTQTKKCPKSLKCYAVDWDCMNRTLENRGIIYGCFLVPMGYFLFLIGMSLRSLINEGAQIDNRIATR